MGMCLLNIFKWHKFYLLGCYTILPEGLICIDYITRPTLRIAQYSRQTVNTDLHFDSTMICQIVTQLFNNGRDAF